MQTIGIIAEFNPFHNGHKFLLNYARKQANAVIVVMSSSFVQRGEPALFDKWVRTKTALQCGADLVLELPVLYATASAEYFATAGVRLLSATGITEGILFGSEAGTLPPLQTAAQLLAYEPLEYRTALKQGLSEGLSFPAARSRALSAATGLAPALLHAPNNILAIEYLKAIERTHSPLHPMTIPRQGGYHEQSISVPYASATAIRRAFRENRPQDALSQIPPECHEILWEAMRSGAGPVYPDALFHALHYLLHTLTPQEIAEAIEVKEGLEHRIHRAGGTSRDWSSLIGAIKTKRYTHTRIQRILLQLFLGHKKYDLQFFEDNGGPPYIRVLGFRQERKDLLRTLTKEATLPVLTSPKPASGLLNAAGKRMLAMEAHATEAYSSLFSAPAFDTHHREFTKPLIIHEADI